MKIECPICGKVVQGTAEELPSRPFCSPRCKMADLGSWLNGTYRISAPIREEDLDEGPPTDGESDPRAN